MIDTIIHMYNRQKLMRFKHLKNGIYAQFAITFILQNLEKQILDRLIQQTYNESYVQI